MPNPRNRVKATGDTHLPEIESEDLPAQESHAEGTGIPSTQERNRDGKSRGGASRGGHHAGLVRKDEPSG
jgi:hypothetical protein